MNVPKRFEPSAETLRLFDAEACPGGYVALVQGLVERGFRVVWPEEVEPARAHLVLRHDVDLDLSGAVAMAELEDRMGVRSSFFVLVSTEFYNPLSRRGSAALRHIAGLGHRIELHFDPGPDAIADSPELQARAKAEASALESASGQAVGWVAFHRPSAQTPWILGHPGNIGGRPHLYAPRWFDDITYVSDGAAYWSHGHPLDSVAAARGTAIQLVTHPHLWMAPPERRLIERVEQVLCQRDAQLRAAALDEFQSYAHAKKVES